MSDLALLATIENELSVIHLFIIAGASPNTDWLRGSVALDEKGFILTGRDLPQAIDPVRNSPWPLSRPPFMLESSLPGVFAVGDVRPGSVKRVAAAVGEGATSVSLVHRALADPLAGCEKTRCFERARLTACGKNC